MSDTVIRIENLSKKYIIGHQKQEKYSTLRDAIADRARSLTQKMQMPPFGKSSSNTAEEEFWALKDVSFEIKQGDRIGIIGRNGAGKSTLLKILSRVTEPTKGSVRIKGRVASLLEVGTGFHPELTGRENIFLNGAILGMSKAEIKKKFDEIVTFAEVEKFLDTPVKRYSSGMYVRLAFAVAAHLEPEILVVDEVLAVGDSQFQKKCLGKMEDVGKEGRTVIFVSHNMSAVGQLCDQACLLESGSVVNIGHSEKVVKSYFINNKKVTGNWSCSKVKDSLKEVTIVQAKVINPSGEPSSVISYKEEFGVEIYYKVNSDLSFWSLVIRITDSTGQHIFTSWDTDSLGDKTSFRGNNYRAVCSIHSCLLKPGIYTVTLGAYSLPELRIVEYYENAFCFEISTIGYTLNSGRWGAITPILKWQAEVVK